MVNAEEVGRIALLLPGATQEGSAFVVSKKGFAWFYQEKVEGQKGRVERLDVLVVRVASLEDKQVLLESEPETYFTNTHFNGYPAVFVRLPIIEIAELTALLETAWRTRATRKAIAILDGKAHDQEKVAAA